MFKSEKGVSAIEFALIAPLLFVLTFGIIEFGILLFDKAVVTNASREGARKAVLYNTPLPYTVPEIEAVVNNYTSNYLISLGSPTAVSSIDVKCYDPDDPTTPLPPPCTDPARPLTHFDAKVTVTYPYSFLVFSNIIKLVGGNITNTLPIKGETRMRME